VGVIIRPLQCAETVDTKTILCQTGSRVVYICIYNKIAVKDNEVVTSRIIQFNFITSAGNLPGLDVYVGDGRRSKLADVVASLVFHSLV
jgi:hypothetical protein